MSTNDTPPATDNASTTPKAKKNRFAQVFWLLFLVVSLGYAWHSFYVPANDVVWAEDYAAAQQLSAETGKPILMFFTADWCVPCRIMKREVFADAEVTPIINNSLVPVMLYQKEPGSAELFARYNVQGTPITILTDAQGEVLNYAVGGIDKAEFLALIGE